MINLKDILKEKAVEVTGFNSVFYGSDFETNAQAADDAKYPMCQIVPPLVSGTDISPRTGRGRDRWTVFVFFCDKQPNDVDTTAEQNDVIIHNMRQQAISYVNLLNKDGRFSLITTVEFKHLFFKFDATVSGVLAMFTLKDTTGEIFC